MAQQKKKAGRPTFLKPSEFHTCNKCKITKPASEFYKCVSRPTGKQPNCKACCRESGVYFRTVLREEYYWSTDGTGYFEKDYRKTLDYYNDYIRADKIPFIYSIQTPSGIYIGCSRSLFVVRKSRHKIDYMRHVRGQKTNSIPGLHAAFDKEGENWIKYLDTMKILETFSKDLTQSQLLTKERAYIKKYESQGITLLNIVGSKNDMRVKKNQ
jgi:hypothetical protein